ncbi:MAG: hypothetical protein J5744_07055 [Oscillospiraceae bacterium]|nr:hypothetical protein [Oscillospiraceae bacterium]
MGRESGMSAEEYFAGTFLIAKRRDRLMSELTDPRKREKGLDRFCHKSAGLIDSSKVLMQGEDLERQPQFESFVKEHEQSVTILSPEPAIDLLQLPFSEAVRIAVMCPDAVIIVGDGFAVVYGEAYRSRDKFLLIGSDP